MDAKDLLNQYYGVNDSGNNIDKKFFNAVNYVDELWNNVNLKSLNELKKKAENELEKLGIERSIKMKEASPYLIDGLRLLKSINSLAGSVEIEKKSLSKLLSQIEISDNNKYNNLAITEKKVKLENLYNQRSKIKEIYPWLLAPSEIEKLLKRKQYTSAVNFYMDLLKKLHDMGDPTSFLGLKNECNLILQRAKLSIIEELKISKSTEKIVAYSKALLSLGVDPTEIGKELCLKIEDLSLNNLAVNDPFQIIGGFYDNFLKLFSSRISSFKDVGSVVSKYNLNDILDKAKKKKEDEIINFLIDAINNLKKTLNKYSAATIALIIEKLKSSTIEEYKLTLETKKKIENSLFELINEISNCKYILLDITDLIDKKIAEIVVIGHRMYKTWEEITKNSNNDLSSLRDEIISIVSSAARFNSDLFSLGVIDSFSYYNIYDNLISYLYDQCVSLPTESHPFSDISKLVYISIISQLSNKWKRHSTTNQLWKYFVCSISQFLSTSIPDIIKDLPKNWSLPIINHLSNIEKIILSLNSNAKEDISFSLIQKIICPKITELFCKRILFQLLQIEIFLTPEENVLFYHEISKILEKFGLEWSQIIKYDFLSLEDENIKQNAN